MKVLVSLTSYLIFPLLIVAQKVQDYPITQVPFNQVHVKNGFWADKLEINAKATLWHNFRQCEETGRIDNFAVAGGLKDGEHIGIYFNDSDVFKAVEGASYTYALTKNPAIDKYLDSLILLFAAAQEEDGYLYTYRTIDPEKAGERAGSERWIKLQHNHELYNVGHLYEAAAAHYQATGKHTLLDVALKNADLVAREFGPGKLAYVPGHEEIEIGLVKLYRATGDEKYLDLAEFFLDQRGNPEGHDLYGEYCQDHIPVTEQTEPVGHAVRACYLYSGMADVAALKNREDYVQALDRIWDNAVASKIYITGGVGARHSGESFGNPYELPNLTAYGETCASIAHAMWNYRMFLLHGDSKYIDMLERIIYNGFLSGVSLDGTHFYYPNPLESDGKYGFNSGNSITRQPWFSCACCPPNILRFMPSILGYYYATDHEGIFINLYGQNEVNINWKNKEISIRQYTGFPWEGMVKIEIMTPQPQRFRLKLRIPGWAMNNPFPSDLYTPLNESARSVRIVVNGEGIDPYSMNAGYVVIDRKWKKGDIIQMEFPMEVHRITAHENVEDDRGKVALQRGPIVYCVEGIDHDGSIYNLLLTDDVKLESVFDKDLLGGVSVIRGNVNTVLVNEDGENLKVEQRPFTAIPYYAWGNRIVGEMAVWLPRKIGSVTINP